MIGLFGQKPALQFNGVKHVNLRYFRWFGPTSSKNLCRTKDLRYDANIWRGHSAYPWSKMLKNLWKRVTFLSEKAVGVQCSKTLHLPFYSVGLTDWSRTLYSKVSPRRNSYDIMLKFWDMLANIFAQNCRKNLLKRVSSSSLVLLYIPMINGEGG